MLDALRSLWREPRPPLPDGPPWVDRAVALLLVLPVGLGEALLREALTARPLAVGLALLLPLAIAFRRHAFAAFVFAFGLVHLAQLGAWLAGTEAPELGSGAFILLLV